jgi:hypothetical protein
MRGTEYVQKFTLNDRPEQKSGTAAGLDLKTPVAVLSDFHRLGTRRSGGLS